MDIDPLKPTDYARDDEALERWWLFCVIVAGKDADWAAAKVGNLLRRKPPGERPLAWLAAHETDLRNMLVANKVGQYARITEAIRQSARLDLRTATVAELEGVFGVGPKTARFFVLHTRPDAVCAVLDTHVLKWLRRHGVDDVPESTPTSRRQYERLEALAIGFMRADFPGLPLAAADLMVWGTISGRLDSAYEAGGFVFE